MKKLIFSIDVYKRQDNYLSIFATLAYSLKNRYVVNANIRNDASNRFGQDANHRICLLYTSTDG